MPLSNRKQKSVTVVGAGSIGMMLTYVLLKNKTSDVSILARSMSENTKAVKESGIILREENQDSQGKTETAPSLVTDNPSKIKDQDLILVTVKSYDLNSELMKTLEGMRAYNGRICILTAHVPCVYDNENILHAHLVAACKRTEDEPGVVTANRKLADVLLFFEAQTDNEYLIKLFNPVIAKVSRLEKSAVLVRKHEKLQFILTYNTISMLYKQNFEKIYNALQKEDPLLLSYFEYMVKISQHLGGNNIRDLQSFMRFKPTLSHYSSMCKDRQNNKPTELPTLIDQVLSEKITSLKDFSLGPLNELKSLAKDVVFNKDQDEVLSSFLSILQSIHNLMAVQQSAAATAPYAALFQSPPKSMAAQSGRNQDTCVEFHP